MVLLRGCSSWAQGAHTIRISRTIYTMGSHQLLYWFGDDLKTFILPTQYKINGLQINMFYLNREISRILIIREFVYSTSQLSSKYVVWINNREVDNWNIESIIYIRLMSEHSYWSTHYSNWISEINQIIGFQDLVYLLK